MVIFNKNGFTIWLFYSTFINAAYRVRTICSRGLSCLPKTKMNTFITYPPLSPRGGTRLFQGMLNADIVYDLMLAVSQCCHEDMIPEHCSVCLVLSKVHRRVSALFKQPREVDIRSSEATNTSVHHGGKDRKKRCCRAKEKGFLRYLGKHHYTTRSLLVVPDRATIFHCALTAFISSRDLLVKGASQTTYNHAVKPRPIDLCVKRRQVVGYHSI